MESEEDYQKRKNKKEARKLQKETGMKYTTALKEIQARARQGEDK